MNKQNLVMEINIKQNGYIFQVAKINNIVTDNMDKNSILDLIKQEYLDAYSLLDNYLQASNAWLNNRKDNELAVIRTRAEERLKKYLKNTYLEIFKAYKEAGNIEKSVEFAKKLYELDPNLPSIQAIIKK